MHLKYCCSWLHFIFTLHVQSVLLCHDGGLQSGISCWADEAQGQMQTSTSLPTALTTPRLRAH